ncbi:MAG: hypothetical protein B7Y39_08360 [Bdellovibrio sp. 28-41-41]|nr:MAG: hypothetical protein B7Y39_08360 [Bdellovibrio sp. 28-41-41]
MVEFNTILKAYRKCARGKRQSAECLSFELKLGEELIKLHHEIRNKTYSPKPLKCFILTEPKPREIWASHFRDRIIHHVIVEEVAKVWDRKLHPKSFACRKGMGLHAAIKDFQNQVRKLSQGGRKTVWILQLDVESFFYTINRPILRKLFLRNVKDPEIRNLIEMQFDVDPRIKFRRTGDLTRFAKFPKSKSWLSKTSDQGIPIGNLTSQYGANLYLNELDHLITRKLKPQGYLRYMDDLTLLDTDPNKLKPMEKIVNDWLIANRKQNLNAAKTSLKPLTNGIDYLGLELHQVNSPKHPVELQIPPKKKWKFVAEAKRLSGIDWLKIKNYHPLGFPLWYEMRRELQCLNSRLGLMTKTNSKRFRTKVLRKLQLLTRQDGGWPEDKPYYGLFVRKDKLAVKLNV